MKHYTRDEFRQLVENIGGTPENLELWWLVPMFIENLSIENEEDKLIPYAIPLMFVDIEEPAHVHLTDDSTGDEKIITLLPIYEEPTYDMLAFVHPAEYTAWGYHYMLPVSPTKMIRNIVFAPDEIPAFDLNDLSTH